MSKVICITGGIGAGKSTVCNYLEQKGYPVYFSDIRAKALMHSDLELAKQLKEVFGAAIYTGEMVLDRPLLAKLIFNKPSQKKLLESIVHPRVHEDFMHWCKEQKSPIIFKESPLAIEIEDKSCQTLVVVNALRDIRISRVLLRNPEWTEDDVISRMNNQIADEQRIKAAHEVIDNSGTVEVLQAQVDQLLTKWS